VHSTRYLRETLLSIYTSRGISDSWELIVVLDRVSKKEFDSSNPVEGMRINCLVIESEFPGIVNALNLGLSFCKGKYIARIDEDDLVSPKRFQQQIRYLEKHPKAVAVGGSLRLIDENGNTIGFKAYPLFNATIVRKIYDLSPLAHPGAMFLSDAVREVGGYKLGVPEDWDLWIRLSKIGKLHNLNYVVISYRKHSLQLSRTKLYKALTSRRLVFLAENRSERELLTLSENPNLMSDLCEQMSRVGDKKTQYKRLQHFENFERLRISRGESRGVIAKIQVLWKISKYARFWVPELLLKTRSLAIGINWHIKNRIMRKL
jgi:glycosyltransferase involved in cell wall biosynthesis